MVMGNKSGRRRKQNLTFLLHCIFCRCGPHPVLKVDALGRLASLVKEHRTRFYIVRRCVTKLVCWKD
jgi:hypothetical protein